MAGGHLLSEPKARNASFAGVPERNNPRPAGKVGYWRADCWTPEEDRTARAMRDEGFTLAQIARRLKRSPSGVYRRLAEYLGGSARPAGAPRDHWGRAAR